MIRELYAELLALVAEEEGKEDRRFKHWAKRVTGVDASQSTGYAFEGDFINEGTVECEGPGVYLVCTRRGSRNYQTATYNVVLMNVQGELALTDIQTTDKTRGWALRIRDEIAGLVTQLVDGQPVEPVTVILTDQAQIDLTAVRERLSLSDEEIVATALAKYRIHVDAHLESEVPA